ncbi:MAG: hypothetical protein VCB43_13585, partial [Myxococcota bacterium]
MKDKHTTSVFDDIRQGILANPDVVTRLGRTRRAEQVLDQINPEQFYEVGTIAERVLEIEPSGVSTPLVVGSEIRSSLRRLIDAVSARTVVPIEAVPEPVLTVREV